MFGIVYFVDFDVIKRLGDFIVIFVLELRYVNGLFFI